jgi:hypothetical protein
MESYRWENASPNNVSDTFTPEARGGIDLFFSITSSNLITGNRNACESSCACVLLPACCGANKIMPLITSINS